MIRKGPKIKKKKGIEIVSKKVRDEIDAAEKKEIAQALVNKRPKAKKRWKCSSEEVEERRNKVMSLRLAGKSYQDIAKEVGVGYMTVKRDLDAVRSDTQSRMSQFDRDYALGSTLSVYDKIESEAWEQYYKYKTGMSSQSKVQFLNMVRTARNDQVKLLFEVGLISKAPAEVKHTVSAKVLDVWNDDAKQLIAMALLKSAVDAEGLPQPPSNKLIDVSSESSNDNK